MGGASPDNHLGGHGEGVDYEVPENIKTLHHLALQYVNQVRQSGRLYLLYLLRVGHVVYLQYMLIFICKRCHLVHVTKYLDI